MSEMTPEQSAAMDFIGEKVNQITRDGNQDKWKDNLFRNREIFTKGNPDLPGTAVFVVAAGPSLEKNVEDLKRVSGRGLIVVLDAALRFVLSRGVKPEFCMMIDGSEKMVKMIEGCDTEGITLITTPSASPDAIRAWKGPIFFVTTPPSKERRFNMTPWTRVVRALQDVKEGDEIMLGSGYKVEFEGIKNMVMCGGNVSTAAHSLAMSTLKAQVIVFCGLDLSWRHDLHHYAGHEHEEGARDRTKQGGGDHIDVNNEVVTTNLSLLAFKRWHEQIAAQNPGSVVNASEGGILGVKQDGSKVDYIEFLTLREAVEKYAPQVSHEGGRLLDVKG